MPADDSVPTIAFPAVERDSGQKQGENIHAFMERRRLHNEKRAQHESCDARNRRLVKEAHAAKGGPPGKRGARVFIWEEEGGFFIRHAYNRFDAADRWDEFTPAQRIYDSFTDQWDLCTALAPNEEAEPEPDYSYDDHDDDDDFTFYAPISPTNIIPSNLDVPGRKAMEEENGERAAQVLERGYDLDCEDLGKNADDLLGWQKQDVSSTVPLRFGFAEPLTAPHSSQRMQDKACAWAIGDETWPIPQTSALPIFLHHVLEGSPDSDLELDWNLEVKILRERDQTLYEIRPPHFEASGPSILLESAATVLHIIRSGLGHDSDLESIIRSLVELGVNFHPSWQRPVHHVAVAPRSHPTLCRRPAGYTPTLLDFGAYVQQRDAFLRSSRGRAALFYGGISGPTRSLVGTGERALWREALTANEINLICGVYTVETGQTSKAAADGHQLKYISWWPTPTAFWSSGLNTGWWNSQLRAVNGKARSGSVILVRKVTANYEKLAANYLDARIWTAKAEQRGSAEVCRFGPFDGLQIIGGPVRRMICGWV
ncbi:hypothetical protein B0H14DRAFT_3598836 [Mycena olivaceomarginata]|nr:hypothetical protein B0H14DRAFT_3598836 [Mycena olivaceomarginata]